MPADVPPPDTQITKEQARYISPSPYSQQCANCAMSRGGNCTLVMGIIEPYAVCQYWEPLED